MRTVKSNGLINQILTMSYLGTVKLPEEMSSVELTPHDGGGTLIDYCEDIEEAACKPAYNDSTVCCKTATASTLYCACQGGQRTKKPHLAGKLGEETMKIKDIHAMATFISHHNCCDNKGKNKASAARNEDQGESSLH